MPIIIDGWNFIRNDRSDIQDDESGALESAEELVSYLAAFQNSHSDPIIVVFDSRRGFLDISRRGDPRLKVVASADADSYIKRYIDKVPERQRRNLRVVSSDNDVYFYAKSSYATPIRCEEFWGKLYTAFHIP